MNITRLLVVAITVSVIGTGGPAHAQLDPLLQFQWHLQPRGFLEPFSANVLPAWADSLGFGVIVGVVDDGIQYDHPDLWWNYRHDLSWDYLRNDPFPYPEVTPILGACPSLFSFVPDDNCHGTAVAGIVAATGGNGLGVSGVAPGARLAGIKLLGGPISDAQTAAALSHGLQSIHVLNNSWGHHAGFTLIGRGPMTAAAMEQGAKRGRNGRGRIYVFAAGNSAPQSCSYNEMATSKYSIAVGAATDVGARASYSQACPALFVSGPSGGGVRGILTTDLSFGFGYSVTDYTNTFDGTSAAAPVVAGTVALMLGANPNLSWRDVKHILALTAYRLDPADPGWSSSFLFPHNEKYGFGLVDAAAAVDVARTWVGVPAEVTVPPVTRTVNRIIPDNSFVGLTDAIVVGDQFEDIFVEHVQVNFTASHPYRGSLDVALTSPTGVVSRLAPPRPSDIGRDYSNWPFRSVRHWGERASGTWTLRVNDLSPGFVGQWRSWTLTIFGTSAPLPLGVPPGPLTIGTASVGRTAQRIVTIRNRGITALSGTSETSGPFSVVSGAPFNDIPPNGTHQIIIAFAPGAAGASVGGLTISSNGGVVNRTLTGTGTPRVFRLMTHNDGTGTGTLSVTRGIACGPGCFDYREGTAITLTAAPRSGSLFRRWEGACAGTPTTCRMTMTRDIDTTAVFDVPLIYPVNVAAQGTGHGTISSTRIACGLDCAESFKEQTRITLSATPASGSVFRRWEGACIGTTRTCQLTVNGPIAATAVFDVPVNYPLNVSVSGVGGSVTATGINCGTDCTETYREGTRVSLTARPISGFRFVGWSGTCSGTQGSCSVMMSSPAAVQATFVRR